MRIALKNSGTTYWLAGDPNKTEREHTSVRGYMLNGERNLDPVDFIETEYGDTYDRKNQRNVVSFATTRKFADTEEAFLFSLDYLTNFPLEGTLIFEIDTPGGGTTRRYMEGAIMQRPSMETISVSMDLEYEVTGREILTTEPS